MDDRFTNIRKPYQDKEIMIHIIESDGRYKDEKGAMVFFQTIWEYRHKAVEGLCYMLIPRLVDPAVFLENPKIVAPKKLWDRNIGLTDYGRQILECFWKNALLTPKLQEDSNGNSG